MRDSTVPPDDINGAAAGAVLLAALNDLLDGERAGARVARESAAEAADRDIARCLRLVARDEAWCCAMLVRHVRRLGGRPSRRVGAFYEKAMARQSLPDRIAYLDRGQAWVVRRLRELVPSIRDEPLAHDLRRMLDVHERNVGRCTKGS